MANIIDYVENNIKTFDESPFNEVDSLVLSTASYFKISDGLLSELEYIHSEKHSDSNYPHSHYKFRFSDLLRAEDFDSMFESVWDPPDGKRLLLALVCSPRFRNLRLTQYVSHTDENIQKQFAAITYVYEGKSANPFIYVAFRGTDSTFIGWKEDFNMAFQCPVPSQEESEKYLRMVLSEFEYSDVYIGGHSKGGNLAVYSAAKLSSYKNIKAVYSHDGPGFIKSFLESEDFIRISPLVKKTVPQSSAIGMIMENQENYTVIKSDGFSFWQHNYFKWRVDEERFELADGLTKGAELFDKSINSWLESYTYEERGEFIDIMYDVFCKSDIRTTRELRGNLKNALPKMTRAAKNLPEEKKNIIYSTFSALIKSGFSSIGKGNKKN